MRNLLHSAAFLLTLTSFSMAQNDESLRFAKIVGNNMVLQQDKPIKIWGWAKAGEKVAVEITQDAAVIDAQLKRFTELTGETISPPNDDGRVRVQYVQTNPPVMKTQTLTASADKSGRWEVTFPAAKGSFQPALISATSGESMVVARNVLVGEIWVCAGQSNMGWSNFNRKTREAASADFPALRYVAWHDSFYKPLDDVRSNINWQECSPETAERFSAVPYLYGMYLHRYLKVPVGIVNVARGGTLGQTWCLREELDNINDVITKTVLSEYDEATGAWDDAKQLEQIMAEWEESVKAAKVEHAAKAAAAKAEGKNEPRFRLPKKPDDPRSGWSPPAGLFNATVMPIRHLGIRGVLYYQGENNNFMRWTRYELTFPKVPLSFRKAFGDDKLPFGCISQPGWGTFGMEPELATVAEGYAIVRDIQRRALADDENGQMIATYPTGNSYIHPAEKLPVAEYASLWALAKVYGKPVEHTGNTYREMKIVDNKLYLYFDIDPVVKQRWGHIEDNAFWQVLPVPREGNADMKGFIIGDETRRWFPAKGRNVKIDGKWCIELTSDLVDKPVAARYGWANWPTGNMVGRARLPVPTFRTDDWPIARGVSYSKEASERSRQMIEVRKAIGKLEAFDRKIKQAEIDVPNYERDLHKGNVKSLLDSKIGRLQRIVKDVQEDKAIARQISGSPEMLEQLKSIEELLGQLKEKASKLE